jgi:hypothetical protein
MLRILQECTANLPPAVSAPDAKRLEAVFSAWEVSEGQLAAYAGAARKGLPVSTTVPLPLPVQALAQWQPTLPVHAATCADMAGWYIRTRAAMFGALAAKAGSCDQLFLLVSRVLPGRPAMTGSDLADQTPGLCGPVQARDVCTVLQHLGEVARWYPCTFGPGAAVECARLALACLTVLPNEREVALGCLCALEHVLSTAPKSIALPTGLLTATVASCMGSRPRDADVVLAVAGAIGACPVVSYSAWVILCDILFTSSFAGTHDIVAPLLQLLDRRQLHSAAVMCKLVCFALRDARSWPPNCAAVFTLLEFMTNESMRWWCSRLKWIASVDMQLAVNRHPAVLEQALKCLIGAHDASEDVGLLHLRRHVSDLVRWATAADPDATGPATWSGYTCAAVVLASHGLDGAVLPVISQRLERSHEVRRSAAGAVRDLPLQVWSGRQLGTEPAACLMVECVLENVDLGRRDASWNASMAVAVLSLLPVRAREKDCRLQTLFRRLLELFSSSPLGGEVGPCRQLIATLALVRPEPADRHVVAAYVAALDGFWGTSEDPVWAPALSYIHDALEVAAWAVDWSQVRWIPAVLNSALRRAFDTEWGETNLATVATLLKRLVLLTKTGKIPQVVLHHCGSVDLAQCVRDQLKNLGTFGVSSKDVAAAKISEWRICSFLDIVAHVAELEYATYPPASDAGALTRDKPVIGGLLAWLQTAMDAAVANRQTMYTKRALVMMAYLLGSVADGGAVSLCVQHLMTGKPAQEHIACVARRFTKTTQWKALSRALTSHR